MRRFVPFLLVAVVSVGATLGAQHAVRFSDAVWTCWNFEDHHRVGVGNHPDIILFVDTPASDIADRRVCVLAEER